MRKVTGTLPHVYLDNFDCFSRQGIAPLLRLDLKYHSFGFLAGIMNIHLYSQHNEISYNAFFAKLLYFYNYTRENFHWEVFGKQRTKEKYQILNHFVAPPFLPSFFPRCINNSTLYQSIVNCLFHVLHIMSTFTCQSVFWKHHSKWLLDSLPNGYKFDQQFSTGWANCFQCWLAHIFLFLAVMF